MSVERRATPLETRFAFGTDASPAAFPDCTASNTQHRFASEHEGQEALVREHPDRRWAGRARLGFSCGGRYRGWVCDRVQGLVLGGAGGGDRAPRAGAGGTGGKTPVGLQGAAISPAPAPAAKVSDRRAASRRRCWSRPARPTRFSTQWITHARSGVAIDIPAARSRAGPAEVASRIAAEGGFDISVAGIRRIRDLGLDPPKVTGRATSGVLSVLAGFATPACRSEDRRVADQPVQLLHVLGVHQRESDQHHGAADRHRYDQVA